MTGSMAEVVATVRRGITELRQRRAEALAAVDAARSAYSQTVAATSGSSRTEPVEALSAIAAGLADAEKSAARFASAATHLETYLDSLDGGTRSPAATSTTASRSASVGSANVHPVYRRRARFGSSTSTNYKKTFFDKHPAAEGQVVVHHAVEQQVRKRYPGLITDAQMHSYENLRGIPKGETNSLVHLSAIRKSWNRFYKKNPNPTEKQLLDHATEIDNMYGATFNPPVR